MAKPNAREEAEFTSVMSDPEQAKKYDEIIELLLAAGYFRARLPMLSPFDKVIGGLTWCVANSHTDIDIDLFFEENANIGMQIKLGESIERAIVRMRCPHKLQAFQIRGLDFIAIFPVIQWLVKRVIETKEETGDLIRQFSEWNFGKEFSLPTDTDYEARKPKSLYYISDVAIRYRPTRKFRKMTSDEDQYEEDRVASTLMEYGQKYGSGASASGKKSAEQEAAQLEAEKRHQQMMNSMSTTRAGGAETEVTGSMVHGLMDSEVMKMMDHSFGGKEGGSAGEAGMSAKEFSEAQHQKQIEALERQIRAAIDTLKGFKDPHSELKAQLQAVEAEYAKARGINQRIHEEMQKFKEMETDENREDIRTLRALVLLNEKLKRQEEQFRANCKKQLDELKRKIKELQSGEVDVEESDHVAMVREAYERDLERLTKHRQAYAKKIRDIAMVERKIDEVPSRSELQQYQLQFIELYEQVAAKLVETRQYYQMYNTLEDTRTFLTKEINILNSINDTYKTAMKSKANKEKFGEQLKNIISSVEELLAKTNAKLTDEKGSLHSVNEKYMSLVERERAYHKLTREFEDECAKNAKILARAQRG